VHCDRAGDSCEEQRAGDTENRGGALWRHAVREPYGDEHDGKRTDDCHEQRRGSGEDRGHQELDNEQTGGEPDECERAAPARQHEHHSGEQDDEPTQRAATVEALKLVRGGAV